MKEENVDKIRTGTTTLAIICKDCAVIAADNRITAGNFISGSFKKVIPITDSIILTIAGVVSDIQLLIKYLKAELKLKEVQLGRKATVKEAANLLANWTYSILRTNFGICHFLVTGMTKEGGIIYEISPDGSIIERYDFVSSGSGSTIVYGVLESKYKRNLTEKEGIELAIDALNSALKRDSASGTGIDVFVLNKEGYRQVFQKEINAGVR